MRPGEFRFVGNGKVGRWNAVPATPGRPKDFFSSGGGYAYMNIMDESMRQARLETNGSATMNIFKEAYYRGEQRFRDWLGQQPPQTTFDFIRDFGDYDGRLIAMMTRYEARRS